MPPRSRNQRTPTGPDTPRAIAASSLDSPSAIFTQNPRSTSRRTGGRPGDRIAGRPVSVAIHPGRLPIQHLRREVLRRPVESTQYTSIAFGLRCREAGVRPSMGSVGDAYDNALCESFFATLECELLDRRRFQSHAEARMAVFQYLEGWYNPDRRHSALAYQSPSQLREEPGAPELNAQAINCPPNRANSSGALECGGSLFCFSSVEAGRGIWRFRRILARLREHRSSLPGRRGYRGTPGCAHADGRRAGSRAYCPGP